MKQLKTAVVGLGFIGLSHVEGHLACDRLHLSALVDANAQLGRKYAEQYHVPWYASVEEMLEHTDVDLVDICVPTFLHESIILTCAAAGKHILCEKPITFTLESYERIVDAVERAGVRFMVAQVIRFWPEYVHLKEKLDQGSFGQIQMVSARRFSEAPGWSGWYLDPEKSGGGLFDLMLHDVDYIRWALGPVKRVFASGAQNQTGCWNFIQANLVFQSGVSAVVECCNNAYGGYPFTMELQILGERMLASYQMRAGHNIDSIASRSLVYYDRELGSQPQTLELYDGYAKEIAYFADCILEDRPCERVSVASSRETLELILMIRQSLESGQVVLPGGAAR
jgi:predicted dehydrogenase